MIKRIVLALDNSAPGLAAQDYAIRLAKEKNASIIALGILDLPWITAAQPEPLGASAFKLHRDEEVIKASHEQIQFMIDEFKKAALKEDVSAEVFEVEGFPAAEIERFAHEADVIIIGKTTDFHFELDEDTDLTVKHVARDNPRPVIAVPGHQNRDDKVLICCDGGFQASRALHMFILLGLAKNKSLDIVAVDPDEERGLRNVSRALRLCSAHGLVAEATVLPTKENPAEVLLKRAKEQNVSMIVMGAFSHSFLREVLFGSVTTVLMKKADIPLFIHH